MIFFVFFIQQTWVTIRNGGTSLCADGASHNRTHGMKYLVFFFKKKLSFSKMIKVLLTSDCQQV